MVLRLAGGVGKKVIKTIIKTKKSEKTQHNDLQLFESAFNDAVDIHNATAFNFKDELKNLSKADLNDMKDYLKHDKTPRDKKWPKLIEYVKKYENLKVVMNKINAAIDTLTNQMMEDLEENLSDEDGVVQMDKVKDEITSAIAVVDANTMQA